MQAKSASCTTQAAGPGRPKDPTKRAAILEAARRMFTQHGYEGSSMDQIATEAGVSKLTVYSHFGDKAALFSTVVRLYCELSLPDELFEPAPGVPLRDRLLQIAQAFFTMATSPEAIAANRVMCAPQLNDSQWPELFWSAGPARLQGLLAQLFARRSAAGELDIQDLECAASQFYALVKGDPHARLVVGQCNHFPAECIQAHLEASVDMFLRAYATSARADRRA